ncbi:AgmX/PglI C-terminal domain-containing protein [Nannocystaceae bacterium ST9]
MSRPGSGAALIAASLLSLGCPITSETTSAPVDARNPSHAPEPIESETASASESVDEPPLSRDEVRLVVRAKLPEVRACFEASLAGDPTLAGRLALRFTIDANGRVRDPSIADDELGSVEVGVCLLDRIEHWQFPRPNGGRELTVVYPFHFTAEDTLRAAGLPRVEGTLRPAAVGEPFEAQRGELDECLRAASITTGSIGVAFTIDDAGVVTKIASYASSLPDPVNRCLLRTISSWSFPAAAAGDEVRVNHDLEW